MPILVKSDDARRGRNAKVRHGRYGRHRRQWVNMNTGSLHTRSFRRINVSVFSFTGPKSFRGFRETGPRFSAVQTQVIRSSTIIIADAYFRMLSRLNAFENKDLS